MEPKEVMEVFKSTTCPHCGKIKKELTGFCPRCYHSLPKPIKNAMWQRFGGGFEEAFNKALNHLKKGTANEVATRNEPAGGPATLPSQSQADRG